MQANKYKRNVKICQKECRKIALKKGCVTKRSCRRQRFLDILAWQGIERVTFELEAFHWNASSKRSHGNPRHPKKWMENRMLASGVYRFSIQLRIYVLMYLYTYVYIYIYIYTYIYIILIFIFIFISICIYDRYACYIRINISIFTYMYASNYIYVYMYIIYTYIYIFILYFDTI